MSAMIDGLLYAWSKNMDYGPKLVADLSEDQMVLQLASHGAPVNHPAWIFSHLNVYLPLIAGIIEQKEFEDPKTHPFGMQSKPESDASIYASKQELIDEFVAGHQRVASLLKQCDDSVFEQVVPLPRWREMMPTAGYALPYLMLNHENAHLGQLSAWRRVQGLASV